MELKQTCKLPGFYDPPRREELPETLFPRTVSTVFTQMHPVVLEELANREWKTPELPEDMPQDRRVQLQNLAQYKPRSLESRMRSLKNLTPTSMVHRMTDPNLPVPATPPGVPAVIVPTAMPTLPPADVIRGKALRLVMSRQEFDLYVDTWNKIYEAHKDEYDKPEDEMDVHSICMEACIQFRIQDLMRAHPRSDFSKQYDASFRRQQMARENLLARRKDRIQSAANKGNTKNTFNVAVIASGVSNMNKKVQLADDNRAAVDRFLEGTVLSTNSPADGEEESAY